MDTPEDVEAAAGGGSPEVRRQELQELQTKLGKYEAALAKAEPNSEKATKIKAVIKKTTKEIMEKTRRN